jgi:hypothetical protein
MNLLSTVERDAFRGRLSRMPSPVHLLVFTRRDGSHDAAARQLGRELRTLSPNVHLELHDVDANPQLAARYGIGRTPAFALLTGGWSSRTRVSVSMGCRASRPAARPGGAPGG